MTNGRGAPSAWCCWTKHHFTSRAGSSRLAWDFNRTPQKGTQLKTYHISGIFNVFQWIFLDFGGYLKPLKMKPRIRGNTCTEFHPCRAKAATDSTQMNGQGCVPNDFLMDAEIWISYYLHVLETTLLICYQLFKDLKTILSSRATQNRCWARLGPWEEVRRPLG